MPGFLGKEPEILNNSLMTDGARLPRFVNKQNMRYWPPVHPPEVHETPLYSPKVTVSYEMMVLGVVRTHFFVDNNK